MPKPNPRLEEIRRKNAEWEKETPYNHCDRWCQRCPQETQARCTLYQQELEQKITAIAHGREPDDPEVTEAVLKMQYEEIGEKLEEKFEEEFDEEDEIDIEAFEGTEFEPIKRHIEFVQNHPLPGTVEQYRKRARQFLEKTYYKNEKIDSKFKDHFEVVAWYYTLLPAKIERALAGFHEPVTEEEFAICDAVAQFDICQKAINKSTEAIRQLKLHYSGHKTLLMEMLALLYNIADHIEVLFDSIS